jgi:hypothetical protein
VLTLFTTAKPFKGHNRVIQRNALQSWKRLGAGVEIIVFGDDEGSAETCAQLGLRHEPEVARTEFGAIRLDDMFARAQALAKNDALCYVNCDILLMSDLWNAVQQVRVTEDVFLMIGKRWDTDVREEIQFDGGEWETEMRARALAQKTQRRFEVDYFVFSKGALRDIASLAIGRLYWDHWIVWRALSLKVPVIDASPVVIAVHQNHDYGHHAGGYAGVWKGEEAKRNFELSGGWEQHRTFHDASKVLTARGMRPNPKRVWFALKRGWVAVREFVVFKVWVPVWYFLLESTLPLRSALGLRSRSLRR